MNKYDVSTNVLTRTLASETLREKIFKQHFKKMLLFLHSKSIISMKSITRPKGENYE